MTLGTSQELALAVVYTRECTLARQQSEAHGGSMTTAQVEFTEAELLTNHDVSAPLIAGGMRCHGGFTPELKQKLLGLRTPL